MQLFGRHMTGRAEYLGARGVVRASHGRGNAEVDQAHCTFVVDQHVSRGHVAMHDVRAAMGVVERATNLGAEVGALRRPERARLGEHFG